MSFFPMVETFFFISLGISFLLIFLMVYHFKNRVDSLEQSNVALADICKTIVYEMEAMKKMPSRSFSHESEEKIHRNILEEVYRNNNIGSSSAASLMMEMFRRSQEEEEEPTSDDPCLYKKIIISDILLNPGEQLNLTEWTEVVEEDEDEAVDDETIDDEAVIDEVVIDEVVIDEVVVDEAVIDEAVIDEAVEEIEEDLISELDQVDSLSVLSHKKPMKNSPYQKMSVQVLRTLVIQKGLCADPSKMKKLDLIQLLFQP
jgi:hypothetical protein